MPATLQAVCPEMASPFPIFPHLFAAHGHRPTKAFHDSGSLSQPNAQKRSVHPPSGRGAHWLLPPGICSHLQLTVSVFLPAATPVLPLGRRRQPLPGHDFHSVPASPYKARKPGADRGRASVWQCSGYTFKA